MSRKGRSRPGQGGSEKINRASAESLFSMLQHVGLVQQPAVCDFCGTPRPQWEFPCRTFSRTVPGHMRFRVVFCDPWAACDPCRGMIEGEEWAALRRRVVGLHPWLSPAQAGELTATWMQFHAHRSGPAWRVRSGP